MRYGFYSLNSFRVRTSPGILEKPWNFTFLFSSTGKSWKIDTSPGKVLELFKWLKILTSFCAKVLNEYLKTFFENLGFTV